MRRILGIALIVALTVLGSVAERTREQLWQSYGGYASPYLGSLPRGVSRAPLTQRMVVVLIHGLRLSESQGMPTLNALRERGADVTIELTPPTYRLPATFSWASGALPETHGITTNESSRVVSPDTIFSTMQASGRGIAVVGSEQWNDLFGSVVQRLELVDEPVSALRDGQAISLALEVLRDPAQPAQFVLVELSLLEDVARNDPDSYNAAVAATDFRLKTLADVIDLSTNTLIVISDRGLTRQGHDGGGEADVARVPFVLAGAGIAPRAQAIAPASSIAPTLAALTGAPIPVHSQSGPIFAVLASDASLPLASAKQLTSFHEQWSEAIGQPRFAAELLRRHEGQLADGNMAKYTTWLAELNNTVNAIVSSRLNEERTARLPFVIGIGLLLLAAVGLLLNDRIAPPLIGAGVYLAAWLVLFFVVHNGSISLSLFRDGNPILVLRELERESAVLMGVVCIFVALATGGHEDAFEAITTVLSTLGLIAAFYIAVFMWFYWQWGDTWTWTLPESSALATALLALTQVAGLTIQVIPTLPELPLALMIAIGAALVYAVVRRRRSIG